MTKTFSENEADKGFPLYLSFRSEFGLFLNSGKQMSRIPQDVASFPKAHYRC